MARLTDEQKEFIRLMRSAGKGYALIAKTLSLSRDTVRSYCKRNEIDEQVADGQASDEHKSGRGDEPIEPVDLVFCRNCGKPVVQVPKRKKKVFCCDSCRRTWWNSHPEKITQRAIYYFVCPTCGSKFSSYGHAERKYCSHSCYIKGRYGSTPDAASTPSAADGQGSGNNNIAHEEVSR